uniref:AAA+ ATPase domain-containing protein n=1 Tax=Magallana gigas TaxID=29159 RepID=A0A8W8MV81_MAGGI|nr:ATP-dependent zinc metalloprotease YME1L1 isoform X2 [Crassostrea gigas]
MASRQRKIERIISQLHLTLSRSYSSNSGHILNKRWPLCHCMKRWEPKIYSTSSSFNGFYETAQRFRRSSRLKTGKSASQQENQADQATKSNNVESEIEKHIADIETELNTLTQKSIKLEKSKRLKHLAEGAMLLLWLYFIYMVYKMDLADMVDKMNKDSLIQPEKGDVTFNDVIGIDEVKEELETVVSYLKDPQKYTRLGANMPKGLLMTGPPGCGKTFLAKATAGEANVNFYYISASSLEDKYVGTGAKRLREVFNVAKKNSPSVVFIDEVDSIGSNRMSQSMDRSFAYQTLHQLLVELDGFENNSGVVVIAATNRHDVLDWALTRPGRFDMVVSVPLPNVKEREDMFVYYLSKVRHDSSLDINQLARSTLGCSGADISNIVNQAAFQAARAGETEVNMGHLEYAKEKIRDGQLKAHKLDQETINIIAVREAAYALVAYYSKFGIPLNKTSILMRGNNIGLTKLLPEGHSDMVSSNKDQVLAKLDFLMAGRAAESMIFGKDNVMKGSGKTLEEATNLARAYVSKYGMSEKAGTRIFSSKEEALASPEYQDMLNEEINRLLKEAYKRADEVLQSHKKELLMLADNLKKYETLNKEDVKTLLKGEQLKR